MEDHDKTAEENLLHLRKEKEEADKLLLNIEAWLAFCSIVLFVGLAMVASFCQMVNTVRLFISVLFGDLLFMFKDRTKSWIL